MRLRVSIIVCLAIAVAALGVAQGMHHDMPMVMHAAKLQYGNVPNIPSCATSATLHGDPSKEAFVMLVRANAGCTVPMHWHSTNEQVALISGSAAITMENQSAQPMGSGSYVFMPARNHHSFACHSACSFYVIGEGAFDIHYIDKAGKEIPAEQALKAVGEKMAPMKE